MADGSTKPISEIEIGDEVLATDPETGESGAREVTALWIHEDELVELDVADGSVTTTDDHPFWNVTDREWQDAQDLDGGDLVLTSEGNFLTVRGLDEDST